MEVALVSAATGALKPILGKLATLVGDEYKQFKSVRGEIKSLTHELTAMDAFLMKMSEEEDPHVQDKVWMTEVRELSYDMEDSIDDFMKQFEDKDAKPDGFKEKIKNSLGKMKARYHIGSEIEELKKQTIEVGERNARYKTRQAFSNTKNKIVDPRALAIFEHASKLVGIDEPKAEIIKLLTKEDGCASTQKRLKIVSIFGSGGMGKTTLANQVYQELKCQFNCWAFLSVSRNPDMMNILRTILSEVSGQRYTDTEAGSIQQLIIKINDSLLNRRFLIVVDDIWDVRTWDVIKHAFPVSSSWSRIITTTRMNDVARSCCKSFEGHIYNIRPLDIVHSKQLFHGRLFNSKEKCPSYLEEVSDQILEKCAGLPLAIIAIAVLLDNTERIENLWNQVKDSIGRALERNDSVEGMMKILSLSYFDLPHHLKTCLLYVSIYPEDSIIGKKGLIRRWIGEGFIHKEGRYSVHEIGERCFNELVNRSLIQPVKTDEFGKVKTCRVHDTILDFIIFKSIEENFVTLVGVPIIAKGKQSKVVRRLSLQVGEEGKLTIGTTGLVLSHVRSLNVFGKFEEFPSLGEFTHLRVLDIRHCRHFGNNHLEHLVRLFQLRYLNLRSTKISELPKQIGLLGCLEILDLRGTNIKELPASIVNLGKLSHLHIRSNVKFPDGIALMQALELLKYIWVSKHPCDVLGGLGQLKNLRNLVLDFQVDHRSVDTNVVRAECKKAVVSSLCKLGTQNLRSLTILNGSGILQEPLCMLTLEKLITIRSPVPQVPIWMSSLRNLRQLRLQVERFKQNDLCILGALPALLILQLNEETWSNERLRIDDKIGFPVLRSFVYDANYCPVNLMFTSGSMPELEKLQLIRLDMDEAESLDFGIKNLPCLITVKCKVNGSHACHIVGAVKTAMEIAVSTHPNHPTLVFESFENSVVQTQLPFWQGLASLITCFDS